jgi:transcriptional regulator with XRE-family HTH domain
MRRGVDAQDPQRLLAQRLRALRESHWPDRKITQPELAEALRVSVPLISSWESRTKPRIPPLSRLEAYAAVFASVRCFDTDPARAISPQDLSDEELQVMNDLEQELMHLRSGALSVGNAPISTSQPDPVSVPLDGGPWRFVNGEDVTIVCARWPQQMLEKIPYTNVASPDYVELLTCSELDALFELFGHLRAVNPANQVNLRIAGKLAPDDLTSHLATLGGIDWNEATSSVLQKLQLPVQQIADWGTEGGQYFEVEGGGQDSQFRPVLEKSDDQEILREDVALFARAVNPFNQERTVTVCNGMYSRGTYGAVRTLTDAKFRDRNADYLRTRFGDSTSYCIVTRVPIINGAAVTPDWTTSDYTLFEWSE